ncbi:hypothetical protein SDC9_103900 [bioreactor metagenome]|uniref:Uncharacterized protein n=1 Tax=bioreactor metagenome TaxID=1076179 RepID=A0A645AV08_9ZZZZ
MAIPPLHHGVLHAGVGRVALHPAGRNGSTVDQVQHGHREDERTVEPVGHVDVLDLADADRAEEHDGIGHPDQRDQDVDGPLQLGIFLAGGVAQRQRDGCSQDDQLPAPECEGGKRCAEQTRLTGALDYVVARGEQAATTERENHRVGVQRS